MRNAKINRKTNETDITLYLNLDGTGKSEISTGSGFMDHMLTLFAAHSGFDLNVKCTGDTCVDFHHSAEDIGICMGEAFTKSLGDMRGITRYADIILPMDEALILCAVDISGRSYLSCELNIPSEKVGNFATELVQEFLYGFVRKSNITLHIKQLSGANSHHIIECCFKALARTLSCGAKINETKKDILPSTKGVI